MSHDDAKLALALEIFDALMVVVPRGWKTVRMTLESRSDGGVRVLEVGTKLAGEKPLVKPALGVEPGAFYGVINEALSDLEKVCRASGTIWKPISAEMERFENELAPRAELRLLGDEDSVTARISIEGDAWQQSVFTEGLFDALVASESQMEARQAALGKEIAGHDDWEFDQGHSVLTLSKGVLPWAKLHAEPIGSFAHESETWLWAWANPSMEGEKSREIAQVRDAARTQSGMGVMLRPSLPCAEGFAVRLAGIAALRMNARGIYGAPFGSGVLFLAVMNKLD